MVTPGRRRGALRSTGVPTVRSVGEGGTSFLVGLVVASAGIGACAAIAGIESPKDRPSDGGGADVTVIDAGPPPRSCAEVRASGPVTDGTFTIDPDGAGPNPPFAVYCYRMSTVEPTEYLALPANVASGLPGSNVSGYVWNAPAGDCPIPPTETTAFMRVRLSIQTMHIDTNDTTFAFVAYAAVDGGATLLPYGSAGSCVGGGDQSGRGNVDFTGTPFRMTMDTRFVPQGYEPGGASTFSPDRKRVDLTGGGFSGSNTTAPDAGGIGLQFDEVGD
jgi:hypothetical protein